MDTNSKTEGQRKIALLGAYDRFNYGDLLFPIIAKNELTACVGSTDISIHALVGSDLSAYGALPTEPLSLLKSRLASGDVVIFVGGGTIGVDWHYMHANLLGNTGNFLLYYLRRIFGHTFSENLSRLRFGARSPFPWVAAPDDFAAGTRIAYNAVGGSEFRELDPKAQSATLARLAKASYLSVRDAETKRLLTPLESTMPIELAPDSALLMSEQFPVAKLEALSSDAHRELLEGNYFCFHCNLAYARKHADRIAAMLEEVHFSHGLPAVLLPIGRYVGLDDQIGLAEILAKVRTPVSMVSEHANIWEIMLTIARARAYVGTSLHGNVTSQSFAVPHFGLSDRPCKVDHYLATWDLPEQNRCFPVGEVVCQLDKILAIPPSELNNKRTALIARVHENFAKLGSACSLAWALNGFTPSSDASPPRLPEYTLGT
jgi:hypothetical protein